MVDGNFAGSKAEAEHTHEQEEKRISLEEFILICEEVENFLPVLFHGHVSNGHCECDQRSNRSCGEADNQQSAAKILDTSCDPGVQIRQGNAERSEEFDDVAVVFQLSLAAFHELQAEDDAEK